METSIVLIRHGQTDWNLKKKYLSFTDVDINERGKIQAKKLSNIFDKRRIRRVYSSDSKRAINFARLAFEGIKIIKVPAFREMNFGIFEGLNHKQIMKKYPEIYKSWLKDPFKTVIPGAEKMSSFKKRVLKALNKIASANKNKSAIIVTHGGPIKIIAGHILKTRNIWDIKCDLASVSFIYFKGKKINRKNIGLNYTDYLNRPEED